MCYVQMENMERKMAGRKEIQDENVGIRRGQETGTLKAAGDKTN